jgi:hypothetical protein
MPKKLSALARHMATIRTGEITKTEVIGIRKAFNQYELEIARREKPSFPYKDLERCLELLAEVRPMVKGDLHESGKDMLQRKRYAKQLANVAEIVADISHFRLVGYEQRGQHVLKAFPVYRCYDHKGKSFPFYVVPWQSGGNGPVIASSNYY